MCQDREPDSVDCHESVMNLVNQSCRYHSIILNSSHLYNYAIDDGRVWRPPEPSRTIVILSRVYKLFIAILKEHRNLTS